VQVVAPGQDLHLDPEHQVGGGSSHTLPVRDDLHTKCTKKGKWPVVSWQISSFRGPVCNAGD